MSTFKLRGRDNFLEAAFQAGVARLPDIGPGALRWALDSAEGRPATMPWWPEMAPLNRVERLRVVKAIADGLTESLERLDPALQATNPRRSEANEGTQEGSPR